MKKNLLQSPRLFFFLLFLGLSSGSITLWAQDTEYDVIDEESEQKKVCWPLINTSKTEATTQRMKTDTPAAAAVPNAGGLAPARNLYTAVEVPNLPFPDPVTIEIYDLFGNPLIINGTTLSFGPSLISATLAAGALGTTPGYHWVGYISNSFQPDNSAVYYYNVFHRWFAGMPGNYHNFGGRQWNSDNSGFANFSDTVFLPHPVTVSIVQPVSCYGFSDGILQANTNPLNFYTYALNGGTPVLSNTFPGLPAGTYTVSIIDTFNNSYDTVINLGQPPSLGSKSVISHCGPFTWPVSGLTYNTSGTYFFNSIVGLCPKTDTLVLTVTNSMTNSSTITAYNFYTWPVNGFTYNTSGTYFFNTNSGGCNVLNILNLTIINTPYNENVFIDQPISCYGANDGSIQAIVFPNYPNIVYQLDGGVQTNTFGYFSGLGPGTHTVCAISGTISVCKTIQLVQPAPLTVTILTDSLVSCLGTDGGLHAHISGGTPLPQGYNTYWYNGMSILLNPFPNNYDTVLTNLMPGAYSLTVEDDHGCFTSTNVQLNAKPLLQVYAWAKPIRCHGGTSNIQLSFSGGTAPVSYTISGNAIVNPYVAGTYTVLATDAKGCTATTSITLSNPPEYTDTTYADACMSYYWSINGQTYTATGVYDTTLQSLGGCLLQNVLHLTIHSDTTINSLVSTCNSYTWPLNNVTYTLSGNYTYTHVNAFGCVETNHLNLILHYNTSSTKNATACDSYNWSAPGASNPYTVSGTYTTTYYNLFGCVHTATLNVVINYSTTSVQNQSACGSYTWPVNSQTYTASGTYTFTSLNAQNCTHTSTLNLTIKQPSTSTQTLTANNAFFWNANSVTYTISGTYTATLLNSVGCDSMLTLNLTINQVPSVLNLKCFLQGYWDGVSGMVPVLQNQLQTSAPAACDTILVELRQTVPPYAVQHSVKTILYQNGNATCVFPPLASSYYISVKHRNTINTWSANPVFIAGTPVTYNFTNFASKAYQLNQIEMAPGKWAFYSGDIGQDENIDLLDLTPLDNDISGFLFGYLPTDINGDGNVDLLDKPVLENNLNDFIYSHHP